MGLSPAPTMLVPWIVAPHSVHLFLPVKESLSPSALHVFWARGREGARWPRSFSPPSTHGNQTLCPPSHPPPVGPKSPRRSMAHVSPPAPPSSLKSLSFPSFGLWVQSSTGGSELGSEGSRRGSSARGGGGGGRGRAGAGSGAGAGRGRGALKRGRGEDAPSSEPSTHPGSSSADDGDEVVNVNIRELLE